MGGKGRRELTQGRCVCCRFYFVCKTDKVRLRYLKEILKGLRVEIIIKCKEIFSFKCININNFFIYSTMVMKFREKVINT